MARLLQHLELELIKPRFKIGDKVLVTFPKKVLENEPDMRYYQGKMGTIVNVWEEEYKRNPDLLLYQVKFKKHMQDFDECELVPYSKAGKVLFK